MFSVEGFWAETGCQEISEKGGKRSKKTCPLRGGGQKNSEEEGKRDKETCPLRGGGGQKNSKIKT